MKTTFALLLLPQRYVFSSKSQQEFRFILYFHSCCCYHKGTYFQANHNRHSSAIANKRVVVATTKVRIFKQITTRSNVLHHLSMLLLLPQRYVFSSKSQHYVYILYFIIVVVATTKVRIFKQITTLSLKNVTDAWLLLLPQRYVFSSKSQLLPNTPPKINGCCCYHKGTYFQANHNW